jgi:hypothetical protein
MRDIFKSAKSVLRRANHHITDLKSAIQSFTPDKPYTYRVDYDSETRKYIHKAIFSEAFSDDISCVFFDAINNLRASLDQMTFAIAMRHDPNRNPADFAPFPFAKDANHWPAKIKGLANDLPTEICTVFEGFQPYKGGNNTLWALNYVANIKKHAILIPARFGGTRVGIPAVLEIPEIRHRDPFGGDGNEIELCRTINAELGAPIDFSYTVVIRTGIRKRLLTSNRRLCSSMRCGEK